MSVVAFPGTNWRDIPALSEAFAKDVTEGKYGEVARVALILDTDHGVHTLAWGEDAAPFYWLGMYQAAGMMSFANAMDD